MFLNILAHRLRVFFFFLFLSLSFDLDSRKHRRRSIPNVSESDGFTRNRRTKKQSVAVRAMDESRDNAWSGGHDRIRKKQITFTRRKYKSIGLVNIWLRWRDIYFCSPPVKIIRIYSLFSYFFFFLNFVFTRCKLFARFSRAAPACSTFFHYFRAGRVRLCLLELAHLPFQVEIKRDREICVHARRSFNTRVSFLWEICCNLSDICHNMYIHAAYYFSHFRSICIFLTHVAEYSILNELWRISYRDARGFDQFLDKF